MRIMKTKQICRLFFITQFFIFYWRSKSSLSQVLQTATDGCLEKQFSAYIHYNLWFGILFCFTSKQIHFYCFYILIRLVFIIYRYYNGSCMNRIPRRLIQFFFCWTWKVRHLTSNLKAVIRYVINKIVIAFQMFKSFIILNKIFKFWWRLATNVRSELVQTQLI